MRRFARQGCAALAASARLTLSVPSTGLCVLRRNLAAAGESTAAAGAAATAASAAARAGSAGGSGGWSASSVLLFFPSAVCGYLAYWQYERMQWKSALIASRERIADAEPADLFSLPESERHEYDKVAVRGRYLHEYSLYVGPRPRSVPGAGIQPGYLVVTPLVAADRKGVVLVNRGWAPASWKEEAQAAAAVTIREREAREAAKAAAAANPAAAATAAAPEAPKRSWWGRLFGGGKQQPAAAEPEQAAAAASPPKQQAEQVEVVGVIQPDEESNHFMPGNEPGEDEFHVLKREAMARTLGLPPGTPLIMAVSTDSAAIVEVQRRSPLDERRAAAERAAADVLAATSSTATSAASTSSAADAGSDGDGPRYPMPKHVGDLTRFTTMPADHRNYMAIWTTMGIALALMARSAVLRPLRGPRIVDAGGAAGGNARDAWKASQAS